jgi:hypothetical protein
MALAVLVIRPRKRAATATADAAEDRAPELVAQTA